MTHFFGELDELVKDNRKKAQDKTMQDLLGHPLGIAVTKPSLVPSGLFSQKTMEDKAATSIYHTGGTSKVDNIYYDKNSH